jgi:hypothetical protein
VAIAVQLEQVAFGALNELADGHAGRNSRVVEDLDPDARRFSSGG